jgi:uncharacterized protein (DUF2342 family)
LDCREAFVEVQALVHIEAFAAQDITKRRFRRLITRRRLRVADDPLVRRLCNGFGPRTRQAERGSACARFRNARGADGFLENWDAPKNLPCGTSFAALRICV